jgi:hypothetical protein
MTVAQAVFVTLDCSDPQALGEFWAAMLGGEVKYTSPTTVAVRTDWMWVAALQTPGYVPPTWPDREVPKQIHLDLAVTDLDAAVAEAERLGAISAPHQPAPDGHRVLFDPAGHPFCLTTRAPREALQP